MFRSQSLSSIITCWNKTWISFCTWFGDLSYSKLKVKEEPNPDVCPLCNAKLRPIFHYGLFGYTPPPETEVEMYLDQRDGVS